MADVATLGLSIDSSQAKRASTDLDKLSGAAGKAETATSKLGGATSQTKEQMTRYADAARQVAAANDNVTVTTRAMSGAIAAVKASLAGFAVSLTAGMSVQPIFAFKDALAEVSTLVDTASFDMQGLEAAALRLASAFGGGATAQMKAFNDVISAGTTDLAKATDIVTTANKLAIGGATSVGVAADGLTSILNSYGDKVRDATSVSDAMFIAMRDGKTRIDELASSLGKVAPIAAQTGVTFDELTAAVAALTLGGISTEESVTGLRAILASVAKPSAEAAKLASALGIEFNTAGLQAKGFAGFLNDLMARTGGSTDQLAILFGGVEALVPAMALAGSSGDAFSATMENMATKAGATEAAFTKMANSPGFQAGRLWSAFQAEVIAAGGALTSVLVPAMRLAADNMGLIFKLAQVVGVALLAAFGPAIVAAVTTLAVAIGTGLVGAVRALTAAMVANPLGALAVAIVTVISAVWTFRDEIQQVFGVDIAGYVKSAANFLVGAMVGAYDAIVQTWRAFPAALADLGYQAAQGFLNAMTNMAREAIVVVNSLIAKINGALRSVGVEGGLGIESIGLPMKMVPDIKLENPNAGAAAGVAGTASAAFKNAIGKDYVGGGTAVPAPTEVRSAADAVADLNTQLSAANSNLGGVNAAAGGAGQAVKDAATGGTDAWEGLRDVTASTSDAMEEAKGIVGGFLSDLRSGLENGEGFWRSFGNAALNVLDKIVDKIQDDLVDALFSAGNAGGGGGGGILGGLLSLFGGGGGISAGTSSAILGGAIGMFAKGTSFAPGGPAIVGERGPELVNLPRGAQVAPNHALPKMTMPSSSAPMHVSIGGASIVVQGNADDKALSQMQAMLKEYDKGTTQRVAKAMRETKRRSIG